MQLPEIVKEHLIRSLTESLVNSGLMNKLGQEINKAIDEIMNKMEAEAPEAIRKYYAAKGINLPDNIINSQHDIMLMVGRSRANKDLLGAIVAKPIISLKIPNKEGVMQNVILNDMIQIKNLNVTEFYNDLENKLKNIDKTEIKTMLSDGFKGIEKL